MEIYALDGTKMASYLYDAWGRVLQVNEYSALNLGALNPFRYRGYYYDTETGLYYLETRYYDPARGRFLNPDGIEYLEPEVIGGLNLYAYCNNNPVMYFDQTGKFPWLVVAAISLFTPVGGAAVQVAASTVSYLGMAVASIWDEDVREDMNSIRWNPFNSDESVVASSNAVSFYKGVPVFRTDGSSGSFGIILLSRKGISREGGHNWTVEDILKHEWGHSAQQMLLGPIPYLLKIGIPSACGDNGDDTPWEITADRFGGVNRPYKEEDVKRGWRYFWWY